MTELQAVILAAGEGNRMRPLTSSRPKVMLPIANLPILEHSILEIIAAGIRRFVFIVGYHDEQIRSYFQDGQRWGIDIRYCNQRQQLGTAKALSMVEELVDSDFIMANGDILVRANDVRQLISLPGQAMSITELPDVTGLGVVEIEQGLVKRLHEKTPNPPTHLANAGLYRFTRSVFQAIRQTPRSPRGEYELTDTIQIMINSGEAIQAVMVDRWFDISYPWDLLSVNEQVMAKLEPSNSGTVEPNVTLKNAVSIGKGTIVRSGAYIIGPVIIGDNCDIGPNCFIRPCTAIGTDCHIGAAVEIKNSIIMRGSKVPHLNYVGDSIIAEYCNLGAGTKIANLRLDKQNIMIDGRDSRRRKLGAIIGDAVQTGINVSINTGTIIGDHAFIGPGALAHGNIAAGSRVF